jgi:ectoine hydroxylase-related dioxygenase (phytanoyl-CoA dioxygenase family)
MNYCAGYIRQQENQQLGIPSALVARMPARLQELVGFGIYHGLIGHIDKRSPASLLRSAAGGQAGRAGAHEGANQYESPMVWDIVG